MRPRRAGSALRTGRDSPRRSVPNLRIRPSRIPPGTGRVLSALKIMSKMLEETRQQPQALTKTLESGLRAIFELRHHFEEHRPRLIIMVARGTSDNAAQFGRY